MTSGWKIGSATVTPVIELEWPVKPHWLIPGATAENLAPYADWLKPTYVTEDDRLRLTIQAFLVESRGQKIIIDTCIGNGKTRGVEAFNQLDTDFVGSITDASFPPEKVDLVICTHLHVDHVGWNTKLVGGAWVPTFPNARYVMARTDYDHWSTQTDEDMGREVFADSVQPIFEHGLADLVEMDHEINPELGFLPTPGHTPGHCSVTISSDGEEAVVTGDCIHHPSQCMHPEWGCTADLDPERANVTRRAFLERTADSGVLVIGTHFAAPTAAHITAAGERWTLVR
ncbi:MAG: MBL fold metallo-hydrolase [Acidobacteriota bacterium]|nr:MBL fold metallo-hydrolase [Acidobacteriota bacterium]